MDSFDPSSDPAGVQRILSLLHPALPLSLPLYRRIQFAHFTPTSRIIVSRRTHDPTEPWLACFTDPDRGPETQLFVYGSWETAGCEELPGDPRVRQLLAGLLAHIRAEGLFVPALRTERVQAQLAAAGGADYDPAADARQMVLCGSVHAATALALAGLGVMDDGGDGEGEDGMPERYNKWIFDLRGADGGEEKLPKGLRWGALSAKHYALVRSRTSIPRQDRTLRMLPDVSIFPTNTKDDFPVAWMFLGVDSSLTTLHVEPEYRGKGLAKALARQAWREHLDYYTTKHEGTGIAQKERWGHADVATWNASSNAVCRSLGGTTMWADYWMRIDLTRLVEHEQ